jgi:predicted nucleotidyltransferase
VTRALERHPAIAAVRLVGSRQRGDADELSDWDFAVETRDFDAVADDLPDIVSPLRPLAQQWDRLSGHETYMLMLPGAIKVDLLFEQPHELEPPWEVTGETLDGVDRHFWDWILWLAPKHLAGKQELVSDEFAKMSDHLLRPMGVEHVPYAIEGAITAYASARREMENRFDAAVSGELGNEVLAALRRSGYRV